MNASVLAAIVAAASIATASAGATVIHVNAVAEGASDGSSWVDALTDLHEALAAAQPGDQIWIAAGVYQPGEEASFHLVSGVALYGGFAGWETELDQRDWKENETILRREGLGPPILIGNRLGEGSALDGLTIRDGSIIGGPNEAAGGGLWLADSALLIEHCRFTENGADFLGGAIYATGSNIIIKDCEFVSNVAMFGGGIHAVECAIDAANVLFASNHTSGGYYGGGIYLESGELNLTGCTFIGNLAVEEGGAIRAEGTPVIATDSVFIQNISKEGGAIFANPSSPLALERCTFIENQALGGAAVRGFQTSIVDCVFERNAGDTGAVRAGGTLTVEDSMFEDNDGGIYFSLGAEVLDVHRCEFIENARDQSDGGGLFAIAVGLVEVIDCYFQNNEAGVQGGAMFFASSAALVENTPVLDNIGHSGGGGISAIAPLTIINCEISGNWAQPAWAPGGVYARDLTMINTTVVNNFPGGVRIRDDAFAQIINSTIAHNPIYLPLQHLQAGLIIHETSEVLLRNSIVWGNGIAGGSCAGSCGGHGEGCWCDPTCCFFMDCCLDQFELCGLCDPGDMSDQILSHQIKGPADVSHSIIHGLTPGSIFDIPGANNIGDDPLFVNPAEGDFRLTAGSPAIDAGNNEYVPEDITTDLDGNPRIVDGNQDGQAIVDMGAYEFQPGEPKCAFADLNCDGVVNVFDLLILVVEEWGPCPGDAACPADLNGNGVVDVFDLLLLLANWG